LYVEQTYYGRRMSRYTTRTGIRMIHMPLMAVVYMVYGLCQWLTGSVVGRTNMVYMMYSIMEEMVSPPW
jgi:hypothetical protein